ncbi:MAG TPA: phosphate regulon sensor histidine kinase PhoR [Rhodocyclaceae bacterium]|nr:phosphate regulon sensor histidine kinase PhoR [Rhodocyclaceae bacterium]
MALPGPVVHALGYTLASAALGGLVGLLSAPRYGWAAFSFGLLWQIFYHLRHFIRLERWSRQPEVSTDLEGDGAWDEVFARLYRHERELLSEIERQRREVGRFVTGGQALIDGIVAVDEQRVVIWCNHAAEDLLGINAATDLAQPITNIVRDPAFVTYLADAHFKRPLKLLRGRGGERVLSIHVVPYGDHGHLLQIRDVTQAERAGQMRRDFVANVSHELRTPLTILHGFVETLHEMELTPAERQRYLSLMGEQSARMLSIVDDLLTLSTLESSPQASLDARVDMRNLLDKLQRDAQALSAGRHRIEFDVAAAEGDLLGVDNEISSALSNLVSNAIRYTPTGGEIRVRWQADQNGGEFLVEDNGIGIDPEHLPRLTERFYRVDRGRSRETGGTGLGLAIVKHVLSRHQAVLDVASTPGKGSCFTARFPAARVVPA